MPRLKERIGGTEALCAKRDDACRIVPSPPKVLVRSTLRGRRERGPGPGGPCVQMGRGAV